MVNTSEGRPPQHLTHLKLFFKSFAVAALVGTSIIVLASAEAFWKNNQKKIVGMWGCALDLGPEVNGVMVIDFQSNQTVWGKTTWTQVLPEAEAELKSIETSMGKYKVDGNLVTFYENFGKKENKSTMVGFSVKENKEFREYVNDKSEFFREIEGGPRQDYSHKIVNLTENKLVLAHEGGGSPELICAKM